MSVAEHETYVGASDEWYTPPEIFAALGERFDLDPCQPTQGRAFLSVPCDRFYTRDDDGLSKPWAGFVFMNPPFGGRNGHVPWLKKFLEHGNGIAIVRAYTSSAWFHNYATKVDAILFPRGKTKFVRPDGSIGKAPGHGVVLLGMGERAVRCLESSGLGLCLRLAQRRPGPQ